MKDHQIAELVNELTSEVRKLSPEAPGSLREVISRVTSSHIKLIVKDLQELHAEFSDFYHQYKCDCEHRHCSRCEDSATAEQVLHKISSNYRSETMFTLSEDAQKVIHELSNKRAMARAIKQKKKLYGL